MGYTGRYKQMLLIDNGIGRAIAACGGRKKMKEQALMTAACRNVKKIVLHQQWGSG
ncbi:hypothetical protein GLW04_17735 [Halobacillus litoralis]|uniref:Uncharacterized protein n=1 Tax=Halobacillus litoralis TaxID=45668 RepID=A0A845E7U6_9BACI|nr:hypothetical protein [Halobacillus litoralis]MYL21744.1 hypothetical protein [Halobacillus litoralis]